MTPDLKSVKSGETESTKADSVPGGHSNQNR